MMHKIILREVLIEEEFLGIIEIIEIIEIVLPEEMVIEELDIIEDKIEFELDAMKANILLRN
jgi:hypothetical protein